MADARARSTPALLLGGAALALAASAAWGQDQAVADPDAAARAAQFTVDNLWMLIATALVFLMHLGFATIETGLTRAKNTVNILFKNVCIVAIGLLTYAVVGFHLMYPGTEWTVASWIGAFHPIAEPDAGGTIAYNGAFTYWTDFIFQGMFAATAATIVSGAVAERVKLGPFLVFSTVYVAFIYPIVGSWTWGAGWLKTFGPGDGFHDFAGSTLVHSVGGWGALAGVIVLGPRLGKYVKSNGKTIIRPIMGHSMPLATIGCLLLWFGWFGFNGGSVLKADPAAVSFVFVTTCLAAAAGIIGAMGTSWIVQRQPDLSMVLNGALAGLVAITAGADVIPVHFAALTGLLGGVIVVLSVTAFDRAKLDDPVGATSVHLVCGIWGTLAVGLFAPGQSVWVQFMGVLSAGLLCFPAAMVIFLALRFTVGIRVSREDELIGLDRSEHGMEAYSGFQIFTTQ